MQRPEPRLNLGPDLVKRQAQRPRVLVAKNWTITVVVDHHELGPPTHGMGKPDASMTLKISARLGGQLSGEPSEVFDQSFAQMSADKVSLGGKSEIECTLLCNS